MMLEPEGNRATLKKAKGFRFLLLSVSSFFLFLFVSSVRAQEPDAQWDARIVSVDGTVTLLNSDNPDGVPADANMPLEAGDRLKTEANSRAEIAFDGNSLMTVEENSDFSVDSLKKSESSFGIALGSLLAQFKSLIQGQNLQVHTLTAVAAVRGTQFGVDVGNGEESHIGVFDEGHLRVSGPNGESPQTLDPNQETSVRKGMAPERPYALRRMARFRGQVSRFPRRLLAIKKTWRRLSPARRRELRRRAFQRMRSRRRRVRAAMERRRASAERARLKRQYRGRARAQRAKGLRERKEERRGR